MTVVLHGCHRVQMFPCNAHEHGHACASLISQSPLHICLKPALNTRLWSPILTQQICNLFPNTRTLSIRPGLSAHLFVPLYTHRSPRDCRTKRPHTLNSSSSTAAAAARTRSKQASPEPIASLHEQHAAEAWQQVSATQHHSRQQGTTAVAVSPAAAALPQPHHAQQGSSRGAHSRQQQQQLAGAGVSGDAAAAAAAQPLPGQDCRVCEEQCRGQPVPAPKVPRVCGHRAL